MPIAWLRVFTTLKATSQEKIAAAMTIQM